jgi:hypothetical protein
LQARRQQRRSGAEFKALLAEHAPDPGWRDDVDRMRDLLTPPDALRDEETAG